MITRASFGLFAIACVTFGAWSLNARRVALVEATAAASELQQSVAELAERRASPLATLEETTHTIEAPLAASATPPAEPPGQSAERLRLASAFRAELRDEAWASATEARIDDALNADGGTSFFSTVECRAALCQLTGHFEDVASYNRSSELLFMAPHAALDHGGAMAIPDHQPDGSLDVTVYVARAGHTEALRKPAD